MGTINTISWTYYVDHWALLNDLSPLQEPYEDLGMMRIHCFLQILSDLNVIEYDKFYDVIYEIRIKIRGK